MDNVAQYLISRDNGNLQIPYEEYVELMKRAGEAQKIQQVKSDVLANLQQQNVRVVFDVARSRVGFAREACN